MFNYFKNKAIFVITFCITEKVCRIFGACAILHNIAIDQNLPNFEEVADDQIVDVAVYDGNLNNGFITRDFVADTFFNR